MLKKILLSTIVATAFVSSVVAVDDYHNYGEWNIDGKYSIYDIAGYVDTKNLLGGEAGDEYVIFNDSKTGYIYKVTVEGDPNAHPDAPNGQPIAKRTFTLVSQSPTDDLPSWGGAGGFYVDDTGIYFGSAYSGIYRWDMNWTNKTKEVNASTSIYSETLARNITTGEWWTADRSRQVYKYNNTTHVWDHQFNYPDLGGSHHDGMVIVNDKLYLSDMTTDKIIAYDLNGTGYVIPDSNVTYTYTATANVEGMGFGPNQHFWFSAGTAYEVGDGKLVPSCSQTFNYTTTWSMTTSECDEIHVPGIDDAVLVILNPEGDLTFSTADAGAKAWLEALGFTVVEDVVLETGQGFWTFGKSTLSQTINNGKSRNNFISLIKDEYTFLGSKNGGDLNKLFAGKPVTEIRFYDGMKWNLWTTGSRNIVPGQGLYVLPSEDFQLNMK